MYRCELKVNTRWVLHKKTKIQALDEEIELILSSLETLTKLKDGM
jgi:hypothetical protein